MARFLYHLVERYRTGLQPSDIDAAQRLLNGPTEHINLHIRQRLREVHAAEPPEFEWLRRQPISSKEDFRRRLDDIPSAKTDRSLKWRRTSGSTGSPLRFPKHKEMLRQMDAAMWAAYAWHGITPDSRQARFWAMPIWGKERHLRRLADTLYSRTRFNAAEITPAASQGFYRVLRSFRAQWAYGYPNLISRFVEHCSDFGLDGADLGIQTVVCTGEMLTEKARSEIASFFSARVINEYGCSESGILSFECEIGTPHLIPWAVHVEADVKPGLNGKEGERGILLTDLYGESLPLLRYRLADIAEIGNKGCPCARNLGVLTPSSGRQGSVIRLPDGREVFSSILAYSAPPEVRRFRARQVSTDALHIEVESNRGVDDAAVIAASSASWSAALPGMTTICVKVVDDIESEGSGKLRYFIPLSEGSATDSTGR